LSFLTKEEKMFFNTSTVKSVSPEQLNEKMRRGDDFYLLDVRTPGENAASAIPGSHLIPLQEVGYRMQELPKNKEIVAYCRVGNRSAYVSAFLAQQGYNVKNLEGGILQWNRSATGSL
jgi:rhodanese-related sulfurtransferase